MTCSALVVTYHSNQDDCIKVYAAHLGSGVLQHDMKEALEKINEDADRRRPIICVYCSGRKFDENYQDDVHKIEKIPDVSTIVRDKIKVVSVNLESLSISTMPGTIKDRIQAGELYTTPRHRRPSTP